MRIVGVVKTPDENLSPDPMRIFPTPALTRRFPTAPFYYQDLLADRHGAADLPRLNATVDRLQSGPRLAALRLRRCTAAS